MPDETTSPGQSTNDTESQASASAGGEAGASQAQAGEASQSTSAEGAGTGEGGGEGAEEGGEGTAPWAAVPKVDELFEHEAVKPHFEERITAAREEGAQATQSRLQTFEERRTQSYQETLQFTGTFLKDWQRKTKDAVNAEELTEFFEEHKEKFEALSGVHWQQGATWGGSALLNAVGGAAGLSEADLATINQSMRYALAEQLAGRDADMSFVDRLLKSITKASTDKATKDAEQRLTKLADEQDKRRDRKEGRDNGAQAADVGGRGSGTPRRYTRDQLKKMTREEMANVPSEERDRALAAPYP